MKTMSFILGLFLGLALMLLLSQFCGGKEPCDRIPSVGRITSHSSFSGGSGTCFLISPSKVITASHCVHNPVCIVHIGKETYTARVQVMDVYSDWAILLLDRPAKDVPLLEFSMSSVKEGEKVTAFGFGHKWGCNTLSYRDGELHGQVVPGDSGGPICNSKGRVIGLINAIYVGKGTVVSSRMGQLRSFVSKWIDEPEGNLFNVEGHPLMLNLELIPKKKGCN